MGRIGEIMTKSSSYTPVRDDGDGEGDNLCLPLLDGNGDLKDEGGANEGAEGTVKGVGLCVLLDVPVVDVVDDTLDVDPPNVDEDEELELFDRGWNHVAGLFRPLALGILNPVVDDSAFPPDIFIVVR